MHGFLSSLIFLSVLIWGTFYASVVLIYKNKKVEAYSRIISFVHGIIVSTFGVPICFAEPGLYECRNVNTTPTQRLLVIISIGYFIVDFIWCLVYYYSHTIYIVHHAYSCVALYHVLTMEKSGCQAVCVLGAMEITNPLLQIRWFLREAGSDGTFLYFTVEILFSLLFILVRLVIGTYITFHVLFYDVASWDIIILHVGIYLISWKLGLDIIKYAYKIIIRESVILQTHHHHY